MFTFSQAKTSSRGGLIRVCHFLLAHDLHALFFEWTLAIEIRDLSIHIESVVGDVLTACYVLAQNGNSESLKVECAAKNNFVL